MPYLAWNVHHTSVHKSSTLVSPSNSLESARRDPRARCRMKRDSCEALEPFVSMTEMLISNEDFEGGAVQRSQTGAGPRDRFETVGSGTRRTSP